MTFSIEPSPVVLDASFAIEALLTGGRYRDAWDSWLFEGAQILVPAHFWAEVANGLLRGANAGVADATASVETIAAAGVEAADRGLTGVLAAISLADAHRLTVYDALYLDLALDVDGRLATLDRALSQTAEREGVDLIAP